jgi:NTE family protein
LEEEEEVVSAKSENKIGYALGGGAARGLAHIGVLKVLEEHGIFPDVIAGTSIGALIGALYAGGLKAADIEQVALQVDWKRVVFLADITTPLSGLIQGKRVISLLKSIMGGDSDFSHLKCPFACVTTDIRSGQQVVLRRGSLVEAVRASISIPGIFTPARIGGRYLVDGGLVNEVPVSVCREMGANYVIGVNVLPDPAKMIQRVEKEQAKNVPPSSKAGDSSKGDKLLPALSKELSQSLRSRLDDIEGAVKAFLQQHQPERQSLIAKPLRLVGVGEPNKLQPKTPRLLYILNQSMAITEYRLAVENLKDADLAISPSVEAIGFWHFDRAAQAIAAGEKAAQYALQQNKEVLRRSVF